jgi:hypothetical protein
MNFFFESRFIECLNFRLEAARSSPDTTSLLYYLPLLIFLARSIIKILTFFRLTPTEAAVSVTALHIFVRGWATRSIDGRTHAGYILNPGKSMRAYAVPGQRITLLFKPPSFHVPEEVNNAMV